MRRRLILPLLSVLAVAGLILNTGAAVRAEEIARATEPTTVVEFFKLLPQKYAGVSQTRKKELLAVGTTITDIKNGFIEFSDCAESRSQIAIFRKSDGKRLVAVTYLGEAIDPKTDELVEASEFHLLQYQHGTWSDLTSSAFPGKLSRGDRVELPRNGTIIKVHVKNGKEVPYKWSGERFAPVKRPR